LLFGFIIKNKGVLPSACLLFSYFYGYGCRKKLLANKQAAVKQQSKESFCWRNYVE
jgi:hypothetical protein